MAWNTDSTANRLIKSYVQDFIDISGSLILRGPSNLYVNGNTTVNGNLSLNNASILTDLSFNKRIFVGGDCSLNGKLTSVGDISINGTVTRCQFNNSSIPQSAFNGTISAPGPDYTKSSVFYDQKFKANADISLNGNIVQVNNININGNVKLSDATLINKYDDNMSKLFDISSAYISSVCFTMPLNFANTDSGPLDGRFHKIKSSASGKIIAIIAGGTGFGAAGNPNSPFDSVDSSWNTYSKFGIYITRDFGNTWTKYFMPNEDQTKLAYSYNDIAISSNGKHMAGVVLPGGVSSSNSPCVIAFSHDYGYTWSSTRYPVYGTGNDFRQFPNRCCISDDGKKIIAANAGQYPGGQWYSSIDYGLSWNVRTNSQQGGLGAVNTLVCNADMTILVGTNAGTSQVTVCALDNNLNKTSFTLTDITAVRNTVSGGTIPGRGGTADNSVINAAHSRDLKNMMFGRYGDLYTTYIELYDATTNTWRIVTPNLSQITANTSTTIQLGPFPDSIHISPSGKYIFVSISTIPAISGGAAIVSSDYGITFNGIKPGETVFRIHDDGSFLSFIRPQINTIPITYLPAIINLFKPNIYKDSTFTTLNITGNLRAGSFPTPSDYRIKNDVAALDETFTIDNLRPVKYLQTLINKTRYGVIAHELQLYYPDLVVGEKDGEDLQYVNYTGLIAILINEIKRLKQEVLELENEV